MHELNLRGARLAREAADEFTRRTPDKPRFVAGVLGPTNRTASISPDVNDPGARNTHFDELVEAYSEAVRGLVEGGADLIMVETIFDTLNAKAALFAIDEYFERNGVLSAGDDLRHHHRPLGTHAVRSDRRRVLEFHVARAAVLDRARTARSAPRICVRTSRSCPASPTRILRCIPMPVCPTRWASTTSRPSTWRACCASSRRPGSSTSSAVAAAPRPRTSAPSPRRCSRSRRARCRRSKRSCGCPASSRSTIGDDSLFVNVGERTNVTGSKAFARLILNGNYTEALNVARQQVESGAQMIDVNMDEAMLDSKAAMVTVPESDRVRAGHLARAGDDRLQQVEGDRSRAQVRAGQAGGQLHQHEGRRGRVHPPGPAAAPLRRGGGRDGLRRAGPGRHAAATHRDLHARLSPADQGSGLSARGHHLRSRTSSPSPPGSRSTTTTRSTSSRRRAQSSAHCRTPR